MERVLRRLEAADLIERDPDPADARSSGVRLSDRGVRAAESAVRAASAAQAAALRDLPPETAQAAISALRAVLIALGDAAPVPPPASPPHRAPASASASAPASAAASAGPTRARR